MDFEALVKHISTIQNTLQAQAAHAVNLALTSRNWLMGCYIVEFEQNGEDRAAYGEQLLKRLEQRLKTKGLNERRFREFRRLYLVYPQLKEPIAQYITSQIQRRCLKRQPSFFVMQPVYYPFLYLKYLWSSQLLLFEKSSYRNK